MNYIIGPDDERMDLFVVKARPTPVFAENNAKLIDGSWFVQTIGTDAEKLVVQVVCGWSIVQELLAYANAKEILLVHFLDFEKSGVILNRPTYDIAVKREDPVYTVDFELAVIPDV